MPSLYWYLGLALISILIAVISIYKKRQVTKVSTFIVFYLFSASITWIGEFIVLGLFDSYAYKPGVFPNRWEENLLGHLILNSSMYPAAATLMVAYSMGYLGMSLITAAFVLAEFLFVKLGIYEQHWWRYYMSVITVMLFLVITRKWFEKLKRAGNGPVRTTVFYFSCFIFIHLPSPLMLLNEKQYYDVDFIRSIFGDVYRSSIMFSFTYHLLETFLFVLFVCILKRWYWKLVPFAIAYLGQGLLLSMDVLRLLNGWKLVYTLGFYTLSLIAAILLERYTLNPADYRTGFV